MDDNRPKSTLSVDKCYIRFMNMTRREVNVIWLNFSGNYVSYKKLQPRAWTDVNTYKTHPWIAWDNTRERLHLNYELIHYPQTTQEYISQRRIERTLENADARLMVVITLPLYRLRKMALLEISKYIDDPELVDGLELPRNLANDLKALIEHKRTISQIPVEDH